ncbi:MAG: hypothetical protein QF797_09685 [Alphaproteobacteria bacterium]|jgi:hypothetical protein|nr:hypothetical protein [Rhodospirillaceae bacterium]MDP6405467.1 hypothetical protein [Alphaproteobacteria bacterium]MDP6622147.1 hypothetical protein [Alphaproteobacteria bacterium]|tara:strand:+ start:895 stop:1236 length:342 start_codon:yes stop_codon:yes gene_type:complete
MIELLGTTLFVFVIITLLVMGFASFMTGAAIANTWRPLWQVVFYGLLLGLADRFLTFALFQGELLSLTGYLIDTAVLIAIALIAYRFNRVNKLVNQYPWIYQRSSPWSYREKS